MTPIEVIEDSIRQMNVAMWTARSPKDQAAALLCKLATFSRLYSRCRVACAAHVRDTTLYNFEQGKATCLLETPFRLLRVLGLRIRIERDPNPRHIMMRPFIARAESAARFLRMSYSDVTGEQRSQLLAKELRHRERKARNQRDCRARRAQK